MGVSQVWPKVYATTKSVCYFECYATIQRRSSLSIRRSLILCLLLQQDCRFKGDGGGRGHEVMCKRH